MLRSLKDLEGYVVSATDGDIGSVANFLLDDESWMVRYLVVDTGGFFGGRRVPISPVSFRQEDWSTRRFHLALTKDRVKNSPSADVDKPVSRQHDGDYFGCYGYLGRSGYPGLGGMGVFYPGLPATGRSNQAPVEHPERSGDVHLRSAKEVRGYHLQGSDGAMGHVNDLIIDDETWDVRYLVIDTRNWLLDKKVLVSPHWTSRVSWVKGEVFVEMSRQAITNSPQWDAAAPINREYEARLYGYYGRAVYWDGGGQPVETGPRTSTRRSAFRRTAIGTITWLPHPGSQPR